MVRLGIHSMMMVVIMPMVMMVMPVPMMMIVVVMVVIVVMVMIFDLKAAHACAERIAKFAIRNVRTRRSGTLTFYVMVVAFLNCSNLGFEPNYLRAIFTKNTGLGWNFAKCRMIARFDRSKTFGRFDVLMLPAFERQNLLAERANTTVRDHGLSVLLFDPLGKCLEHFGVIVKIARFDKVNIGMLLGNLICEAVNTINQYPREKEVRKHNHSLVAKLCNVL